MVTMTAMEQTISKTAITPPLHNQENMSDQMKDAMGLMLCLTTFLIQSMSLPGESAIRFMSTLNEIKTYKDTRSM